MRLLDEHGTPAQRLEADQRREVELVDLRRELDHLGDHVVLVHRAVAAGNPRRGGPRVVSMDRPLAGLRDLLKVPQHRRFALQRRVAVVVQLHDVDGLGEATAPSLPPPAHGERA
eukprot:1688650-Lingulodinium_polyedra.AAC.1